MTRGLTIITLLFSLSLAPTFAWAGSEGDCENQMFAYLQAKDPSFSKKYFNLQAKLTLHRMAWAYLTQVTSHDRALDENKRGIESVIDGVLRDLNAQNIENSDDFKKAHQAFIENSFSRKSLKDVVETLRPVLEAQKDDASPYHLELEDLSFLSMIAEVSGGSAFSSKTQYQSSIINPLKLISSAYANKSIDELKGDLAVLDRELKNLQKTMASYEALMQSAAKASQACSATARQCDDCPKTDSVSFSKIRLTDLLKNELKANQYAGIRFGEIWLRTRYSYRDEKQIQGESSGKISEQQTVKPATGSQANSNAELKPPPPSPVKFSMQYDKNFGFKIDPKDPKTLEAYEHAIPEKLRSAKLHADLSSTIKDITTTSDCLVNRAKFDPKSIESVQKRIMAELYQQYPKGYDALADDIQTWSQELRASVTLDSKVQAACAQVLGLEYTPKTRPIIQLISTLSRDELELKQNCQSRISRDDRTALAVLRERKYSPNISDTQWKTLVQKCDARPWTKDLIDRDQYLELFKIKNR